MWPVVFMYGPDEEETDWAGDPDAGFPEEAEIDEDEETLLDLT